MTLNGFDISSWQAGIDVAALPGVIVPVKLTGGVGYVNPAADAQIKAVRAAGKLLALYHFAHEVGCAGSAAAEAAYFVAKAKPYLDSRTALVLDWEGDNVTDSAWALAFKQQVEALSGRRLWVYGSVSQIGYLKPCFDAGSPLWVAAYTLGYQPINGYNPPMGPLGLPAWAQVTMWQYTSTGRLPGWGGNLDLNIFYGDGTAWDKLTAPLGAPVKPQGGTTVPVAHPVVAGPTPHPTGPTEWIVDPGDMLSTIAPKVGVSLGALISANPGIDPNLIRVGQHLRLPAGAKWPAGPVRAPAPIPAHAGPIWWIVDPGDNMSSIAGRTGVSLAALIAANPGVKPNLIYPGQRLNLPAGAHW